MSDEELAELRAELARERAEREQLVAMMRQANEQLILAGIRSETLRERLAAALDASGTGTFRAELRGEQLEADDNVRALFGVGDDERFDRLADLIDRVAPEDRDDVAARWAACRAESADLDVDFRVLRGERPRWVAMRGRTYLGAPGSAAYVLGACVDITDRKRVAAEQAANRAKDEFLAMLGHELRNPLAPILTALHLMRGKAARGEGDVTRERGVIERQVEHLVRLVDDLLDVSRIARGKVSLEPARIDLGAVIATALELSAPLVAARDQRLAIDAPAGDLFVDGDRERLIQVLTNLLTNAAKYTPRGGRIAVRAAREGDEVVVSVTDDGVGIPAHLVPHVFDLFVQGERAPDRREGGLGVGLTIVRSLVEMHGGRVSAASGGPGQGSVFTVRLPAESGAAAAPSAAHAATPASAIAQRVLVVDDNVDVAELVAEVLRGEGHTVHVAHDGAAALRAAEEHRPDVALVDIGLPVMDGYQLAANLRARLGAACPRLIAVTGYGQPRDRARSAEAGFDRHLVKPVDVDRLLALMNER